MRNLILALGVVALAGTAQATDVKISLAELPNLSIKTADNKADGPYPNLLKLIDEYYEGGSFEMEIFAFGRSLNNIQTGAADAHVPLIQTASGDGPNFQYVDEPLWNVTFVVYSRKDNPISRDADFSKLKVDTLIGHEHFFDFKVGEVTSIETGLKKLVNKRTDAFIKEQDIVDSMIKANGYDTVHRALYEVWGSSMILPKTPAGDALNVAMTEAIRAAKKDERYKPTAEKVHNPYNDWQP
ncbi:hypothetical protein [Roseibium sp.]|uniref:hypothetical protein n=1 Tax=Roseibium sp. TaxID=1936156 RepID=UPI003B5186E7